MLTTTPRSCALIVPASGLLRNMHLVCSAHVLVKDSLSHSCSKDEEGRTAVVLAAGHRDARCVQLLLGHAAQVTFPTMDVVSSPIDLLSIFWTIENCAVASSFGFQ